MKIALVHDWLIHMRGGEKVLESFAELYPDATIYTLLYDRRKLSPSLASMKIKASFLNALPGIRHYYRWLLPLMPFAVRGLKIDEDTKIVLSSSHCVAKGIEIPKNAVHICYCHTPMRYLWGFERDYLSKIPFFVKPFVGVIKDYLRKFDLDSNQSVHHFIANAENVRTRIKNFYGRDSEVIYPPVDTSIYSSGNDPAPAEQGYYLAVSAFVPYKRVDLVIEAFNNNGKQLLVVGGGPLEKYYRSLRKNSNISFLGSVSNSELRKLYKGARALLFPTEEDFGIVPLEAQACGTPVIAYGKGGALESVKHGLFFEEQTPEAIQRAIEDFEKLSIDRSQIPAAVEPFKKERFKKEIAVFVEEHAAAVR